MQVRGVLFDVDDTLFDYSGSEEAGILAHLRESGLLERFASPAAALDVWRSIMRVQYGRFLAGELTFAGQQCERTRQFLAHLGEGGAEQLTDGQAAAWFAGYAVHRDAAWAAFPDAAPVLAALAPVYRLGVVSNSSVGHQRRKLDAVGLLGHFEDAVLVCSDEFGQAKPAPGIFRAGCERLGLAPHEVAYVGDNYDLDALGARDAGLRAFWLDRSAGGAVVGEGIGVLHALTDLPHALAAH
ncbi:putative hydrolase of the HAD superfamily [Streptomyces sp. 1114.5]|uniref:HAD family hydrolase n=1 Tax=Streptomyces sp. 1114.5 TaxID=1938830 RepID=UPI000EB0F611|nr:HAD family hydrolase [Streptomyces sp. 1114.5]RKT08692.1 putative hydrolase of the HAD superfamily [Streptomyces sp. 1114.5]